MNFLSKISVVACSALVLTACDSDDNVRLPDTDVAGSKYQILHASPDAPLVNLVVNGSQIAGNVDYKQGTRQFSLPAGTSSFRVDAILPDTTVAVIDENVDLGVGNIYTIAAINTVDALEPIVIAQPDTPVAAGSARLFVLHATPGAAPNFSLPVNVYVDTYTEPNAPIGTTAPLNFDFKETLGPVEVAAGDYQIRVTLEDGTPVYDSGRVELAAGLDLVVAAVPNVSGGPAALTLVALTGEGSVQLLDVNTPTGLRVGHLSPDTPAVDVLVNGGEYLADVEFPAVTPVVALPADTYEVAITVANNPGAIAFGPANLTLEAGRSYSVLATDFNANLAVKILDQDDPRSIGLFPKVRIYHASPTAEDVDIYLVAEGGTIEGVTPALTNVPFGANTGYLGLSAGTFDVVVTPTETTIEAIRETITIEDGGVYTAIAHDPVEGAFGLIVQEDVLVD